jgi:uncharacterized membrane protein YhiD involved in acid resistance
MQNAVNFADIFKKNFLEIGSQNEITISGLLLTLFASFLVALFIFLVYKKCYRGVIYSHSFNVSIMLMSMITTMIIVTISSNIILSLGMVGALSIVRFRTAIKDPVDLVFLFWAVAAGIAVGARIFLIASVGSLVIGLTLLIFMRLKDSSRTYLLVINYNDEVTGDVRAIINKLNYVLRTKTAQKGKTELTIELKVKNDNTSFVNAISDIEGVQNVVLVSYSGDFAE